MSLQVYVIYEPDGSPPVSVKAERTINLMVSRLQSGADLSKEVHTRAKGELTHSRDDYMLFWPERKAILLSFSQSSLLLSGLPPQSVYHISLAVELFCAGSSTFKLLTLLLAIPASEPTNYMSAQLWIPPKKQLGLCRLEAGTNLEYRIRRRRIKIRYATSETEELLQKFLDASYKLLVADVTRPVKELVQDICEQLRIEHPEELSLVVASDYAVQKHHLARKNKRSLSVTQVGSGSPVMEARRLTLSRKEKSAEGLAVKPLAESEPRTLSPSIRRKRPGSASGGRIYPNWTKSKVKNCRQISKKHQIRLDTPWLDPNKTLAEQEVTESDELILMYRYYYHLQLQRESANVEMLYKQARITYLAGELLCSLNDMVRLSAILCQISKGNYSMHKYSPDFISTIKSLIAPPKCKVKALAKQILAQHASLEGVCVADAKCWLIKLWSSLELFGMEFLSCTNIGTKDKGLIGVSKDKIMFLYRKKKKNLFWDMNKLVQWTHEPKKDSMSLTFSHEKSTEVLNLSVPEYSSVLADCLQEDSKCSNKHPRLLRFLSKTGESGHREVGDTIPEVLRVGTGYQFDDDMESAISIYATETKRDAKVRLALTNLTFADVYWISKIENPLFSQEELAGITVDPSWENPAFGNLDQLMDERFNFLDFCENSDQDDIKENSGTTLTSSNVHLRGSTRSSLSSSPLHSSPLLQHQVYPDSSPLTISHRSSHKTESSSQQSPHATKIDKDELLSPKILPNGIMATFDKHGRHSRNWSGGSASSEGSEQKAHSESGAAGLAQPIKIIHCT